MQFDQDIKNFVIFITMMALGVMIEDLLVKIYFLLTGKKLRTIHFSPGRFLFLLVFPFLTILFFSYKLNTGYLNIFIIFAVLGTVLEWLIGYAYKEIVGKDLWTYHQYTYKGHSSLLSVPLWGLAGVMFQLLMRAVN